jgi:hypothetical protein
LTRTIRGYFIEPPTKEGMKFKKLLNSNDTKGLDAGRSECVRAR